jgi:hypothetical protein
VKTKEKQKDKNITKTRRNYYLEKYLYKIKKNKQKFRMEKLSVDFQLKIT